MHDLAIINKIKYFWVKMAYEVSANGKGVWVDSCKVF